MWVLWVVLLLVVVVSGFRVSQLLREFVCAVGFWFGLFFGWCFGCHKLSQTEPRGLTVYTLACFFLC